MFSVNNAGKGIKRKNIHFYAQLLKMPCKRNKIVKQISWEIEVAATELLKNKVFKKQDKGPT
jgi:hypothetical protein